MLFSSEERQQLLKIAYRSLDVGLELKKLSAFPSEWNLSPNLTSPGAAFVTLELHHELRGCMGELEATGPLAQSVWNNAYYAAFEDSRFSPLTREERAQITLSISVLTPPVEFPVVSEEDLVRRVRPGRDGLILQYERKRGTFLPAVWESLPDPREFIRELKQKAGLNPDFWHPRLKVKRYETILIADLHN